VVLSDLFQEILDEMQFSYGKRVKGKDEKVRMG
jgi:hypothetical protein